MKQRKPTCEECKKPFTPTVHYKKNGEVKILSTPQKFCSVKCRQSFNARTSRRRNGTVPYGEQIRTCEVCGVSFTPGSAAAKVCGSEECIKEKDRRARKEREATKPLTEREKVLIGLRNTNMNWPSFVEGGYENDELWDAKWDDQKFKTDKRHKSTRRIVDAAGQFIKQEGAMSLRHIHYHLVSLGLIQNTKAAYSGLAEKLVEARLRGDIGMDDIEDDGREAVTYSAWDSPEEFLNDMAHAYTSDLWATQSELVEVWTEKNSIVRTIEELCRSYRVPIRPLKGQGSLHYLWKAAKGIRNENRVLRIYYLGDHDPSGYTIEKSAFERLCQFLMDRCDWTVSDVRYKLNWKRIGFTHDDLSVREYNIKALDADDKAESAEYDDFCEMFPDKQMAELEALPPQIVRERVKKEILSHIDVDTMKEAITQEEEGRDRIAGEHVDYNYPAFV